MTMVMGEVPAAKIPVKTGRNICFSTFSEYQKKTITGQPMEEYIRASPGKKSCRF